MFVKTQCENFTLCMFLRNTAWKFVESYSFTWKTKPLMKFWKLRVGSVDKILVFFYFNTKESLFCEHTKTKKEVEQAGTTCNTQKRAQTT